MNRVDESDLDPNSWAEHSAHLVQDTPSSLRGPAVMGAEIPKITATDDLDSDLGFVLNCGKMSAFEREYYYTKNIML